MRADAVPNDDSDPLLVKRAKCWTGDISKAALQQEDIVLVRKMAAFAVVSSLALTSTLASAREGCWYPNEAKAAQLLEFNSRLMAGAFQCRDKNPSVMAHYNTFVNNQREVLQAHDSILKARFDREAGDKKGRGKHAYDQYLASATQHYSQTPEWNERDCARVVSLARVASQLPREELLMLSGSIVDAPLSGPCRPSRYSFDDGGALAAGTGAAVSPRNPWDPIGPATGAIVAPPAADQMRSERPVLASRGPVATLIFPAEQQAQAGASTTNVAVAPPQAVTQSGATSAEFLQTAVAALQVAAAALQMAMSHEVESNKAASVMQPPAAPETGTALANAPGELPPLP